MLSRMRYNVWYSFKVAVKVISPFLPCRVKQWKINRHWRWTMYTIVFWLCWVKWASGDKVRSILVSHSEEAIRLAWVSSSTALSPSAHSLGVVFGETGMIRHTDIVTLKPVGVWWDVVPDLSTGWFIETYIETLKGNTKDFCKERRM